MAIAYISLDQGNSTTDAGSFATNSISPSANALNLITVVWANAVNAQASALASIIGNGLTWVMVDGINYGAGTSRRRIEVWRSLGAAPTTGAITVTFGETATAYCWSVLSFTGVDTSGTNGSGAIGTPANNRSTSATSLIATLGAFADAANATFGAGAGVGSTGALTVGGGFTEAHNQVIAAGTTINMITEYLLGNDTTVDVGQSSLNDLAVISAEIKAAAAVAAGAFTPVTYARPEVPETTVGLATRGGSSVLAMLEYSALSYSRRLDDMSDCNITVPAGDCPPALEVVNPWEHELIVWRGTDEVWVGPVQEVTWTPEGLMIRARDLFQWLERQIIGTNNNLLELTDDLAGLFMGWAFEAVNTPAVNTMLMEFRQSSSGVTGTRSVASGDYRYASDDMREMARTAVDWTMVGRELWAGGEEFIDDIVTGPHTYTDANGDQDFTASVTGDRAPRSPTAPLITEHIDRPSILKSPGASEVIIRGAITGSAGDEGFGGATFEPVGIAGGLSATLGNVEVLESDLSVRDTPSAEAAAEKRLALIGGEELACRWLPDSSVRFWHLVPGARVPVKVECGCHALDETMRLVSVDVAVQGADEVVTLRLGPVSDA